MWQTSDKQEKTSSRTKPLTKEGKAERGRIPKSLITSLTIRESTSVLLVTSDVKWTNFLNYPQQGVGPGIFCLPLQIHSSALPPCSLPPRLSYGTTSLGPLAF